MHYCFVAGGNRKIPVAMRKGETPVPIPNTTVKTLSADSTMLETAWEDRWLPDLKRKSINSDEGAEKIPFPDDW